MTRRAAGTGRGAGRRRTVEVPKGTPYLIEVSAAAHMDDWIVFASDDEDARDMAEEEVGRSYIWKVNEATAADVRRVLDECAPFNDDELRAWLKAQPKGGAHA